MARPCNACGRVHPTLERCDVAARRMANEVANAAPVVHNEPRCEFTPPPVVHTEPLVVHGPVVHMYGKYRDAEARRKYRREWTARDRAKKAQQSKGA